MTNPTLINGVEQLVADWTDFIARLTALEDVAGAINEPQVQQWTADATAERDAVAAQQGNLDSADDIDDNLTVARPLFEASRNALRTIATGLRPMLAAIWTANTSGLVHSTITSTQRALTALDQTINKFLDQSTTIATDTGGRANLAGLRDTVDDLSTFPILTQGLGGGGGVASYYPSGGGGGGGGAGLGQIVDRTISEVLGRRPRLADTKSFVAALTNSFAVAEHEGHTIVTWRQRTGSGVSELGAALTGAQASLHQRARGALEDVLPVIDALEPLIDADEEEMQAVRAIVRNQTTELVNELGIEGGPRVQRVNDLFSMLLTHNFPVEVNGVRQNITASPDLFAELGAGEIGRLGYVFGLTADHVNTILEEQNLTNFIVLRDHVQALFTSWRSFEAGFVGETQTFFGTQLVHVTRTLGVIAESVDEAMFAMDSVFFGRAERDTTRIDFSAAAFPLNGQHAHPRMFVTELLSWVRDFATDEGPRLIQDGGKLGARGCVPTLDRLFRLTRDGATRIRHPAARHPRVVHAMQQLASQLEAARSLVESIR